MANAGQGIGSNPSTSQKGPKGAGKATPGKTLDEHDLASDLKGDNSLQGEDQNRGMNERQAQAGARPDTDELLESFKKSDKHYRAKSDAQQRTGKE